MAHDATAKARLRACFVGERLPMELACVKAKVARATGNRWKREAAAGGDDWEQARAALALGDGTFADTAKALLNDYLLAHQATMVLLRDTQGLGPLERVEAIASLSDSFNKTMSSFRKLMPETDRLAVAMEVLKRLTRFVAEKQPKAAPALLEVLEAFGAELSAGL